MYPRFFLIFLMMCAGCAWNSQPSIPLILQSVTLKYDKPYPLRSIPTNSYLYITCSRSESYDKSKTLINALKKRFKQNGFFQITDHIDLKRKFPTYILNISHFVESPKLEAHKVGIRDMHEVENICEQQDSLISHVSLYDPRHFEIQYVFMLKSIAKKTFEDENDESFESRLSRQIFNEFNKIIFVKSKSINAFIPASMDQKGKNLLINYKYQNAKSRFKAILPSYDFSKQTISKTLKKYAKWHHIKLRNIETDLTNYYGYLLACEACEVSEKNLYSIFKGYQSILGLTKNSQLIKACSHSLGRLEYELSQRLYPM